MSELYLIAHKVRGEPAFDVAERVQIGEEKGWIIPTSGHRAYPWWFIRLDRIFAWGDTRQETIHELCFEMPDSIRDHYAAVAAPAPSGRITALNLADLGL